MVLMAKARIGYLVVFFGRNSHRVCAKTVVPERVSPCRTHLSPKDPGASSPPLVTCRPQRPGSEGGWARSPPSRSLAFVVTENRSKVVGVDFYPARVMGPWARQLSKSPWSLALVLTDNQSEGRWAGIYPVGVMHFWACQRSKSPWSSALAMTDNQSEGRRGGIHPARVMCPWAWQRAKSPWSLALIVTDTQSEGRWGRLDPARLVCLWA